MQQSSAPMRSAAGEYGRKCEAYSCGVRRCCRWRDDRSLGDPI
jgi:hypothetical protein